MLDWSQCPVVESFPGPRVPVKALFQSFEGGATLDKFLEWFPGVAREQVEAVLAHAGRSLAP